MIKLITSVTELPPVLADSIGPEENCGLHFSVTPHFAALARSGKDDPIKRQFFPDSRELLPDPFALDDPLGEGRYQAAPGLIHRYQDRALLLAAGTCAGFCRYCFRRVWLSRSGPVVELDALTRNFVRDTRAENADSASVTDFQPAMNYLAAHPEIREILVSGGDPLTLDNTVLEDLFRKLRTARPGILIRVCTRIPITEPLRLDSKTIALFTEFQPLRMAVHINHPWEISPTPGKAGASAKDTAAAALSACVNAGITVLVQTVLLRGINDDAVLLTGLYKECLELGLSPYYLFQMDLAPGTAHFRVPLKRGLAIYHELCDLAYGWGLPHYALDLPGGGGKILLHKKVIAGEAETPAGKVYVLKDANGRPWYYPA